MCSCSSLRSDWHRYHICICQELNALLLGEESAQHLGVEVERVKRYLLVAAALLTRACVSVSGMIAFVGLVIPHIVRMLFGSDHRILLPSVALIGAIFLLLADSLSRIIIAPSELPVGIITALVGGPFSYYCCVGRRMLCFNGWRVIICCSTYWE